MPSNQTTNYQLSQWAKSDQVKMEDFNADNAKIDGALASQAEALAVLTAAAPHRGNCQIWTTTYKGTGNYTDNFGEDHPNSLTFPKKPLLVTIYEPDGRSQMVIFPHDNTYTFTSGNRSLTMHITWSGNTVTWYVDDVFLQMNWLNYTYVVIAFWPMD